MADIRIPSELGLVPELLEYLPARTCIAKCTFCFSTLLRKSRGDSFRADHDGGTFERSVSRAFGPGYDPTDFTQWALRNGLPIVASNTVEPFQSVDAARGMLRIGRSLGLSPFFITRGTNWREVWDDLAPLAPRSVLNVSLPTLDPKVIKRFEPGTPPIADRLELLSAASAAGFRTILALTPYHPEWCDDPAAIVREAHARGACAVYLDGLHLHRRQADVATDREMVALAARTEGPPFWDRVQSVRDECARLGMQLDCGAWRAPVYDVPTAEACVSDAVAGTVWPYVDRAFLAPLERAYGPGPGPPILVTWPEALAAMERRGKVEQPFSWKVWNARLNTTMKKLPPAWQAYLAAEDRPMREYFRGFWNTPGKNGFAWRHPFVRLAVRPDGSPWLGESGDVVMSFDAYDPTKTCKRVLPTLDGCRRYSEVC